MTEPEQQQPEEAVTFADEKDVAPAQEASESEDDVGAHRVNEGL